MRLLLLDVHDKQSAVCVPDCVATQTCTLVQGRPLLVVRMSSKELLVKHFCIYGYVKPWFDYACLIYNQ